MMGHLDVAKALLDYGASTNIIVYGCDMLHASIQSDKPEVVSLMLDLGYDINRHDALGMTPLENALRCKYEAAEFLLNEGADFKRFCADGSSLIRVASDATGRSVELLIKYVQNEEGEDFLSHRCKL